MKYQRLQRYVIVNGKIWVCPKNSIWHFILVNCDNFNWKCNKKLQFSLKIRLTNLWIITPCQLSRLYSSIRGVVSGCKFSKSALEAPYSGPNSWGASYGEHKQFLEFSESQFKVFLFSGSLTKNFRDDCTECIRSVFSYSWFPETVNLFFFDISLD